MKKIYLDNNATTAIDPQVATVIMEELSAAPSNPSSIHHFGREARKRLTHAREQIAAYFGLLPQELIFTSSGTEALNLALLGAKPKGQIITSPIEHASVYNTLKRLDNPMIYLPVGPEGHVHPSDLKKTIGSNTSLIILSAVNSETGVKIPLEEIAAIAEYHRVPFILDGVAWLGKEMISIPKGVTAIAFSGHKIHGPKGIGLLLVRKQFKLEPLITGGGQEFTLRSGTENLPGIIGFSKAIHLLKEKLPEATTKMERLRNQLEEGLKVHLPRLMINGASPRICNTSCITFQDIDGESLLIQLDLMGVAASMGSACSSGALEPSRTLLAMGLSREQALSTLRFSLSRYTTQEEINKTVKTIISLINPTYTQAT